MKKDLIELYRTGKFYNVFGDDAIIIHYLLGYKILATKGGTGFPESAYNKVVNALEENKISYISYNKEVLEENNNFSKHNNYKKYLKKGIENLSIEERINKLTKKIDEMTLKDAEKVLKVIEDARYYL